MTRRFSLGIALLLLIGLTPAHAESAMPPSTLNRQAPRIGLVLGGGGARGFAHLGVLKELERLHIPIACISGTSAGALIGGIYASGVSVDEMERTFAKVDWPQVLSGKPPRADVPYERKRDDYKNYLDLTLGLRDGSLVVPRRAINSQGIDLLIHKLTRDRDVQSFDQLPIPFRAVATDLETGTAVVYDRGNLANALRASMAVPGVFDLVEDGNRLLVDGMLSRNVPVQDVKGRCADRVIVVDVSSPMLKHDDIHSVFDVLSQTTNIAVANNVREQMAKLSADDIVIRPDLGTFSAGDFEHYKDIAQRGQRAVQPYEAQLKALSVPVADYAAWHARLQPENTPLVDEVKVADTSFVNHQAIESQLASPNGQPQTVEEVQGKLAGVFNSGDFERLSYRIMRVGDKEVLEVLPVEKTTGRHSLQFGLSLKGSTPGSNSFALLGSHEMSWLNSAGASWRNELYLGQSKSFRSELMQPFSANSPLFAAASYRWSDTIFPVYGFNHLHLADLSERSLRVQADLGSTLGKYGEVRLGVFRQHDHARYSIGDSINDSLKIGSPTFLEAGTQARLVIDQFDNPRWPRHGYFLDGTLNDYLPSLGSDTAGRSLNAIGEMAGTLGDTTIRLTGKYKANLSGLNLLESPQMLGGFLNLSGYQQDELVGQKAALLRLMAYQRVATMPSALGSGIYLGGSLEYGKLWNSVLTSRDTGWLPGASLFLGADTLMGPFFIGIGHAQGGVLTGYMFLGVDY